VEPRHYSYRLWELPSGHSGSLPVYEASHLLASILRVSLPPLPVYDSMTRCLDTEAIFFTFIIQIISVGFFVQYFIIQSNERPRIRHRLGPLKVAVAVFVKPKFRTSLIMRGFHVVLFSPRK